MAFLDFADTQYTKTVDTGEEVEVGAFQLAKNLELSAIRPTIYITGTSSITTEKFRMNIYSDVGYTSLLYQSSYANISDIVGLTTKERWMGWVRLDFNRESINKNIKYYPTLEVANYTRNGDTFYVGFNYDFPFPIYDNSEDFFFNHPLQTQIFGYLPRSEQ